MKKLITITLLLIASISFGQEKYDGVEVDFADLQLVKSKTVNIISAFKVKEGYIIFKKEPIRGPGGWRYFIETRDTDLKTLSIINISEQFEDENYIIERIIRVGNSYALFSTKTFRKEGKTELYLQTFNWESGKLSSTKKIHSKMNERRNVGINFKARTSIDNKLLMYEVYDRGKDKVIRTNYIVLDEALEEVWSMDNVFFKLKEGKIYNEQSTVLGNNGEIYVLGYRRVIRNRKAGIKQGEKEFEIAHITEDGVEIIKIDTKDHKIDDVTLTQTKDGKLFFGGYYLGEKVFGIEGVFLLTMDNSSLEVNEEFWSEFTHEFITEGWSGRQTKKAKKKDDKGKLGLADLYLRQIFRHDDGSISLIGERYWVTTTTTTSPNGGTTTTVTYHYGDLVITRISSEGELVNQTKIRQHTTYEGAYQVFSVGNNVFVTKKNKKVKMLNTDVAEMSKEERKKHEGYGLEGIKINAEGEKKSFILLDYMDDEYKRFRKYTKIGLNSSIVENDDKVELLVVTYKGSKKWAIGRFSFSKEE